MSSVQWSDALQDHQGRDYLEATLRGHVVGRIEIGTKHYRAFVDLASLVNADESHAHLVCQTYFVHEAKDRVEYALKYVALVLQPLVGASP